MIVLEQGYEIVEGVFSDGEIEDLRAAIAETIDRTARALRTPFAMSRPEASLEERIELAARGDWAYACALLQAVMADTQRDPRLEALSSHPRLRAAVERWLAPAAPHGWTVRPRAVIPSFAGYRSGWHQDVPKPESGRGCASVRVACWIPLSDVDERTGALEVIPGPWKGPFPHEAGQSGQFHIAEEDLPAAPRRILPMRKGDLALLDRFLPHRSVPTEAGRSRWAVAVWVNAGLPGDAC